MKALRSLIAATVLLCPLSAYSAEVSQDYVNILENRLGALEQQVTTLTNQVEQANYNARQAQERLQRLEEDMGTRFRMLENNAASADATSEAPAQSEASPQRAANNNSNNGGAERSIGQLTSSGADLPNDPNVAYDQAFSLIRNGDYEAAEVAMGAFLQKWPNHELSSNASYWKGETLYVRGDYKVAAKAFADGYQQYPKGAKAEDTLLKLALSLSALNRAADACVTFEQMSAEFPRMSANTRRRVDEERKQLDCPSSGSNSSASSSRTPARTR